MAKILKLWLYLKCIGLEGIGVRFKFRFVLLFCPFIVQAQPIESGGMVETMVRFRPWPVGLGVNSKLAYQLPFYDAQHRALERNGLEAGVTLQTSPVSLHPGAYLKVTPLTVLEFEVGGQWLSYFGLINSVLLYPSAEGDWSLGGRERQRDRNGLSPASGVSVYGIARLKLMLSSLVLVSEFEYRHLSLSIDESEHWYDPERNRLMKQTDNYKRSLSIVGWLLGEEVTDSDMIATAFWYERNELNGSQRSLGGFAFVRQRRNPDHHTRWLALLAIYTQDQYQQFEPFGAFIWQRAWSL